MQKLIGYARVSSADQNLDLQVDALIKAGCHHVFKEKLTGVADNPPEFIKALQVLSPGDVFVVWKLDRASRSVQRLIRLVNHLREKKIFFRSLMEGMDTTTPAGEMIYNIMASLAQFERSVIMERVTAGMEAARRRGRHLGRKFKLTPEQVKEAQHMLADGTLTMEQVAATFGVHRVTLSRYIGTAQKEKINELLK